MTLQVLVIDDDAAVRTLFEALLSRHDCCVHHASDGEDGLAKLNGGSYDAIILDLMMPKLDGIQLLDIVRKNNPSILKRIVVATGASQAYLGRVNAVEVHAVIRKPFDIDQLIDAVLTCGANIRA
jgi:CheY-like chemotaxis protein